MSEAFDLVMEKETAYSNLARSGDELLLMASAGAQEEFVQRVSSAICKNIRNETIRECDGGSETIPTNFLKNCQYCQGSTSNQSSGGNSGFNGEFNNQNNNGYNNNFGQGEWYYGANNPNHLNSMPYKDNYYSTSNGNQRNGFNNSG